MSLKLKIDENLPGDLAGLLLAAGHDAVTVGDEDLVGASDERFAKSLRHGARALITLDADLGNIVRFPPGLASRERAALDHGAAITSSRPPCLAG